jgi:hypothetical protein
MRMKGLALARATGLVVCQSVDMVVEYLRGNNIDSLDYQRDEHHMQVIVYHLIWHRKRRSKVLVNQIGKRCEGLIR